MTNPLSPLLANARLDHISIVVRELAPAIKHFSAYAVEPFQTLTYTNTALVYGRKSTYTLEMALAKISPVLDLEVICHVGGEHEIHERFLRDRGEGVQHIGYQVEDFEAAISAFTAAGFPPILIREDPAAVSAYMDTTAVGGTITELIRKGFNLRDLMKS